MKLEDQLNRLYKIQEDIRIVQESGLWEPLHDAKLYVIKLIKELESRKPKTCLHEPEEFEILSGLQGGLYGRPMSIISQQKVKMFGTKCKYCGVELKAEWSNVK